MMKKNYKKNYPLFFDLFKRVRANKYSVNNKNFLQITNPRIRKTYDTVFVRPNEWESEG